MGGRGFAWLRWGFIAAMFSCVPVHAAHAQDDDAAPSGSPLLRGTYASGTSQPSTSPPEAQDSDDDDTASGISPPIPSDDPTSETQGEDSLEPAPAAEQRGTVNDGDPNSPAEPAAVIDGDIDAAEKAAPQDGADGSVTEPRDDYDVGLFDNPPAGYDPLLFSDRRSRSLRRQQDDQSPFPPGALRPGRDQGRKLHSLPGIGVRDVLLLQRLSRSPSDWSMDVKPSARLVSNWATNALELRAAGRAELLQ